MNESVSKKLDDFFTQYKKQQYKQKEILIRADDNPTGIFYLKEGTVKVYTITKNGDELVLNMFKPVSFFPMSYALTDKPNKFFYEAITQTTVWKAPKEQVVNFVKENPDVLYDLLVRLYSGIDGLLTRMSYLMSANARTRLIAEIIIYSKRFHNQNTPDNPVQISITEKDLAAMTGLTRETVSRELKVLKGKGLISFARKALTIHNNRHLESELLSNS